MIISCLVFLEINIDHHKYIFYLIRLPNHNLVCIETYVYKHKNSVSKWMH